jgi:hypothetical protein
MPFAEPVVIDQCGLAPDVAFPLQPADAGRNRCLRQADGIRQLGHGKAAVILEGGKDFPVDTIQMVCNGKKSIRYVLSNGH